MGDPIGVQRSDQGHVVARPPSRVAAHEVERVQSGFPHLAGSNGDDRLKKFIAVGFGFSRELVIDGIAVLRTLSLQEHEGVLPNLVGPGTQADDRRSCKWVAPEPIAPAPDQRVGWRLGH